ncbi:MAG: ATP-binding protein [Thermodesulfobacteriota bacterium]
MASGSKSKLLLAVLLALSLGLLMYFAYGVHWHQRDEVAKRLLECESLATLAEQVHLAFVDRYVALFRGVANVPSFRNHETREASDLLRRIEAEFPETENLAALARNGCFFASAKPLSSPPRCIPEAEFFRRVAEGAPYALMQPHTGPVTGVLVTGVVVPIPGEDGGFNGAVGASIRYSALEDRWEAITRSSRIALAVYGANGVVRFASGEMSGLAGERIDGKASFLARIAAVDGVPTTVRDGVAWVASTLTSTRSGLTFVALAPKTVGMEGYFSTHAQAYWMLCLILLLLAAAGYLHWKDGQWVKALSASEIRFRMILEHSPVGISLYDARTGACVAANRAMAGLVGAGVEDVLRQNFRQIESWKRSGLIRLAEEAIRGHGTQRMDLRQTTSFGKDVLLDCLLTCFESQSVTYLLLIAADIAEKHRMQQIMVQTEKMMNLGGLAAGMAHEINNPLSGIIQGSQVLGRRLGDDTPANRSAAEAAGCALENIRDYLGRREVLPLLQSLRDSAVRASSTVKGMLEFARKTGGEMQPCDLNGIMDKALQLSLNDYDLKSKYDFRKVIVEKHYASDLPEVYCTANQIEQVLLNLMRNAAQAMGCCKEGTPGAKIVLRTVHDGEFVRMEVEDNGPGMPEEVRKRVFEPFFSTKGPGEGTGLGLSVSYFIITANHKGSLEVESEPGRGTKFIIRLPVHPPEHASV